MDFGVALLAYMILLFILLWYTTVLGMDILSSITISLLLSSVLLILLIPPSDIETYTKNLIDGHSCSHRNNIAILIVLGIYIITLIMVIWYVLCTAYDGIDFDAIDSKQCTQGIY